MPLYEHLPSKVRETVDSLVEELGPEPWPTRFLGLIGWLGEMIENGAGEDPALVLQQWTGVVTAFLEHLPPDSSVMECQALMSISYNDIWRAQAIALIDRDPSVVARLAELYPSWEDIVADIAEAAERRPVRAG